MSIHPAIPILQNIKTNVFKIIEPYLRNPDYPSQFQIPPEYLSESDFHWQIVRDYPERQGKYLRGSLIVLVAAAMGADPSIAYQTAAAMQISEDWILIHDDFEDGSSMRRGKPALQKIYGDKLAVNCGDALHALMWKILADNHKVLGVNTTIKLIDEFYRMLSRTILGQSIEINWTETKKPITDEDWYFIADSKTGYYSIAGPMRIGALIANANDYQLNLVTEMGQYLGRCFQLVDDLLDLTSNFQGQKKSAGADIYEGKRTIPLGHLMRSANTSDLKKIEKILGKSPSQKTEADINFVIEKMHHYGSINYAKSIAQKYRDLAMEEIDHKLTFLSHQPETSNLKTIVNFILERNH